MTEKLLIVPWHGPLPEWFGLWAQNVRRLAKYGFHVLLDTNEQEFAERAREALGVVYPLGDGRKTCDYRCALGEMYRDEIRDYEFWGHTDIDMVYGRVEEFVTDLFLAELDIHSNHPTYVSGPWTLYRNTPYIYGLFRGVDGWRAELENPRTTGWVETTYSSHVDAMHDKGYLRRVYTNWQTRNLDSFDAVHWDGERLMEGREEIMVAHFRRTKEYPRRCR